MTADESVEFGVVDKVIASRDEIEAAPAEG